MSRVSGASQTLKFSTGVERRKFIVSQLLTYHSCISITWVWHTRSLLAPCQLFAARNTPSGSEPSMDASWVPTWYRYWNTALIFSSRSYFSEVPCAREGLKVLENMYPHVPHHESCSNQLSPLSQRHVRCDAKWRLDSKGKPFALLAHFIFRVYSSVSNHRSLPVLTVQWNTFS